MDPSVLYPTLGLLELNSHQKQPFEVQNVCKNTIKVASTGLAAWFWGASPSKEGDVASSRWAARIQEAMLVSCLEHAVLGEH